MNIDKPTLKYIYHFMHEINKWYTDYKNRCKIVKEMGHRVFIKSNIGLKK